jgi:hypothetical protein
MQNMNNGYLFASAVPTFMLFGIQLIARCFDKASIPTVHLFGKWQHMHFSLVLL